MSSSKFQNPSPSGPGAIFSCPECKKSEMLLVRRMPYKKNTAYERQNFLCEDCDCLIERIVGKPST